MAAAIAALMAAYLAHNTLRLGGQGPGVVGTALHSILVLAVPVLLLHAAWRHRGPARLVWLLYGLGAIGMASGELLFVTIYSEAPPFPSWCDAAWLSWYPLAYVASVLLLRVRLADITVATWLDGAICGLAAVAVAAATFYGPLLQTSTDGVALTAMAVAYPIGDLALLTAVTTVLVMTGWRPGRTWSWVGAGLLLMFVADTIFNLQSASASYAAGGLLDTAFPLAGLLLARAAWLPTPQRIAVPLGERRSLAAPAICTLVAFTLASLGAAGRFEPIVMMLALAAVALALIRAAITVRDHAQLLVVVHDEAITDSLTGLRNRRQLRTDLAHALSGDGVTALALYDLNGFKTYNDAFGHGAGDVLLARGGRALGAVAAARGDAYRLGGDEFCILIDAVSCDAEEAARRGAEALAQSGDGFLITASYGLVRIPEEAATIDQALALADQRMYAAKATRPRDEGLESSERLVAALRERSAHGGQVTARPTAVPRYLGVSAGELDQIASDPDRVNNPGRTKRQEPGSGASRVGARAAVDHSRRRTAVREDMSRFRIRLHPRLGSPRPLRIGIWRVLPLLLAAGMVIVGMLAIADHARAEADRARQAQVIMEHLGAQSQRLDAITWRSLGTAPNAVPPRAVADGLEVYLSVSSDLRALHRLGVPRERVARLEQALGAVYRLGMQSALLARRDSTQAHQIATTSFSATLEQLSVSVATMARAQGETARRAQRRTRDAWIGSLLVGLLLLMLLGWRMHRVQRSAAMANAARAIERHAEQRLRALVRHSSDVVVVLDPSSEVRWIAESVRGMLGYEPTELEDRLLSDLLHPEDSHRGIRLLEEAVQATARSEMACLRLRAADGEHRHVEIIADNRLADPDIGGILLNLRDVSDRRALEEQLRHQSFHDSLTGLPNRALFDDRLTQALARRRRHANRTAVVLIDVDDFKAVNDSLGHAVADEVLRQTAERIHATLRTQDSAARLGGDEFAVLLDEVASAQEAVLVAKRIHLALIEPLIVGDHILTPSVSIGVACPEASETADTGLGSADVAMYEAKQRGKGQIVVFEPAMRERVTERLLLTTDLASALKNDEFVLEYQPVVELETGAIRGVEALLRWEHPVRGRVGPDMFIGLAEDTGHIVSIGLWVLEAACRQLRRWQADLPEAAALEMNVNVSTCQLADPTFPASVRRALEETGLEPHRLTLEITESALLVDSDRTREQLQALKACGILLAIDDFGTGYSALSYLQTFPIDVLKIDRSFVSGIDIDTEKAGLVQGIVEIGNNLNMRVVIEGIEEPGEAALLREIHAGFGQGYLFSRPVDPRALAELLTERIPDLEIS